MASISTGSIATIDLAIGDRVIVETDGDAYVDMVSGALGAGYNSTRLFGSARKQMFGPYGVDVQLAIRAIDGTTNYATFSPVSLKPRCLAVANDDVSGVDFYPYVTALPAEMAGLALSDPENEQYVGTTLSVSAWGNASRAHPAPATVAAYAMRPDGDALGAPYAQLDCTVNFMDADTGAVSGAGGLSLYANYESATNPADAVHLMRLWGGKFSMAGMDVPASDGSAHMTVGGVQYSIAKAIKVSIDGRTYFWPLFGPV